MSATAVVTEHKLHRIVARFPWRRRRPRSKNGRVPVAFRTREGQQVWADPRDLITFEDPGPALVCAALHSDERGHHLVRTLVEHHAGQRGQALGDGTEATRAGLVLLDDLIEVAGLDPGAEVGPHTLREVLAATWAVAAGVPEPAPEASP